MAPPGEDQMDGFSLSMLSSGRLPYYSKGPPRASILYVILLFAGWPNILLLGSDNYSTYPARMLDRR